MELSPALQAISESATLQMARRSRELQAEGKDVVNLSLGEPDQDPPAEVLKAAHEALDGPWHKYPPVNGYADLREAISMKFLRDNGLRYSAEQIVVSTGAKQAVANVIMSLIGPGDEVVLPAPFWVSYEGQVQLAGGTSVIVHSTLEEDFKVDPERLAKAITAKTKLLIFSSPCNPTGSVFDKNELEAIAAVVRKHPDLIVMCDEIYEHIVFTGSHTSFGTLEGMADRTVTVNGLSKAFAMTGWRLGYIGAPLWLAKACMKLQGQITSGANSITQRAAIAAMQIPASSFDGLKKVYKARRDLVLKGLNGIPGLRCNKPEGAFYLMPDVRGTFGKKSGEHHINSAKDLSMYLLEEALVAVVDGDAFGAPGHVRISYSTSEDRLREGIRRMAEAIAKLK